MFVTLWSFCLAPCFWVGGSEGQGEPTQSWAVLLHTWQLLPLPDTHPSFYTGCFPQAFFHRAFLGHPAVFISPLIDAVLQTAFLPFSLWLCLSLGDNATSSALVTQWCPFGDLHWIPPVVWAVGASASFFAGQCSFEMGSRAWGCSSFVPLEADRNFLLGSSSFVSLNVTQMEQCAWSAA